MIFPKENISYTFTLLTPDGRTPVEDFWWVEDNLKNLLRKRNGFVRLEVTPPIDGKRYLETIFDENQDNYCIYILEDRPDGQGYLYYRDNSVPINLYKYLYEKKKFKASALKALFLKGKTGIRRSIVAAGVEEELYTISYEINSCVFDEKGSYGAMQGRPKDIPAESEEGKRLRDIIARYYPNYNETQKDAFLKKLNSEGCGYVAVLNTLFAHFEGKEDEFEQKLGFPMYGTNGDLNFNALLVDFYAATDNHYCGLGFDWINYEEDRSKAEKGSPYNYSLDTTGYGTTSEDRNYRAQLYLKKKGIKVRVRECGGMSPGKFKKLSQKGYVLMSLRDGNIRHEDGRLRAYNKGGHSMVVTGITCDGRYIVSTWGEKCYVDPSEIVVKDGKKTEISYEYVEYR